MTGASAATDASIRDALRERLRMEFPDDDDLIIDELGLCQGGARIDLAVVNGAIHGYEIKGERDTLDRLPAQQAFYSLVLDRVTVVCAWRHTEKVAQTVPWWWGIDAVSVPLDRLEFEVVRPAALNPSSDPAAVAQLLWRDEALNALTELQLATGLTSQPRRHLLHALVEALDRDELGDLVRRSLKTRTNWLARAPQTLGDGSFPLAARSSRSRVRLHGGHSERCTDRPR
jgi:hypothetical protein